MNTALLRMATKDHDGVRRWSVPGAPNQARLVPADKSFWKATAFHWPCPDPKGGWMMRGCRLDWHRGMAKSVARSLIA